MKLDKLKFASLISFIQVLAKHQLERNDIETIDGIIDINSPVISANNPEQVDELLRELNNPNGFINAIKAYRTLTGAGLKEGKEAVEKYRNAKPALDEQGTLYLQLKHGRATYDQQLDAAAWIKKLHA